MTSNIVYFDVVNQTNTTLNVRLNGEYNKILNNGETLTASLSEFEFMYLGVIYKFNPTNLNSSISRLAIYIYDYYNSSLGIPNTLILSMNDKKAYDMFNNNTVSTNDLSYWFDDVNSTYLGKLKSYLKSLIPTTKPTTKPEISGDSNVQTTSIQYNMFTIIIILLIIVFGILISYFAYKKFYKKV